MTANAKLGIEIVRNAPTVDTLSALESALEADQSAHGREIVNAMSWARITSDRVRGRRSSIRLRTGGCPSSLN